MLESVLGPSLGSRHRTVVVLGALVTAAAHLPVIAPHLSEAPYMGALFIVLTASCLALAGTLLVHDGPVVYALSILTCGLAIIGYAATRLTTFPMLADDVGNWLEPLGIVSICSETVVMVGALLAIPIRMGGGDESSGDMLSSDEEVTMPTRDPDRSGHARRS